MMDPIGLALENFDAVGRWRTLEESGAADRRVRFVAGRHAIRGRRGTAPTRCSSRTCSCATLTEKMMTYALGRGLEHYDAPAMRAIVRESGAHGLARHRSLILRNRRAAHRSG